MALFVTGIISPSSLTSGFELNLAGLLVKATICDLAGAGSRRHFLHQRSIASRISCSLSVEFARVRLDQLALFYM